MTAPTDTTRAFTAQLLSLDNEQFDRGERLSESELDALAVADRGGQLSTVAAPLFGLPDDAALPTWYMPAISRARVRGWHRPVVIAIIAVLLLLEALGLCSIFGQVVIG